MLLLESILFLKLAEAETAPPCVELAAIAPTLLPVPLDTPLPWTPEVTESLMAGTVAECSEFRL